MGDYGCKFKCALLCKTYGCVDWKPSCDSVYCDCKEQWEPITIEADIVTEFEGLVDFDDVLAVKFKRTPVFLDLEDTLYENPDLMDEVMYFLRHTHGHGKPFKDQFRLTFPELDDLLRRLKPRPPKEQKGKGSQSAEVPNEPLGNLDPPSSRWGFLSDWWNKPSPQVNSKENEERIINMVNEIEKKEDLLSTMKMLKDSGDTPLYTDITKHFLENGLIMADGTRILEPISDTKVLKKSLANDGILHAIDDKIKEEEEFKKAKKRKQMQQAPQAEEKPKIQPVMEENAVINKTAGNQPEESKSSFWGVPNWFSSKPTGSNPSEVENVFPQVFLPKVNPSEYSNFDTELPKPGNINNQYLPHDDQAESIYDDGYYSETSQENLGHNEEANSLQQSDESNWKHGNLEHLTQSNHNKLEYSDWPADDHNIGNQFDDYNQHTEFQSAYPFDQDIEFIDQEDTHLESDILQNPKDTPTESIAQSNIAPTEPDWFNFSWEQDNLPISPVEEEFLKQKIPQTGYGSLTPQLENNAHLVDTPFANVKLDQPALTDSSPYLFGDSMYPQQTNPQNIVSGDQQEVISQPDGFDLGSSISDESSDGRDLHFFFSKQPTEESTKQINIPSSVSTPIINKNASYPEESDEDEANKMLQNLLKLSNVSVNNSMPNENADTLSVGTRNLGSDQEFDELQLSNPKKKLLESSQASSLILDDTSTFDDDYIIERTHLNRLHGIIPDLSESIEHVPVKRIIRKKKVKPIEETAIEEAFKGKATDKSSKESMFSFPQSMTSIQFEGLPGSPILQIDGLPSQQLNSNVLSKGTLPKSSAQPYPQSTIQEPKDKSSEKPNSYISEGLKNILPAYVTDDFSSFIEDMNESEPEKFITDNDRVEQQFSKTNYKPGAHIPTNIVTDGSILPPENSDGSNNSSEYTKKINSEQLQDTPHGKFNTDVNFSPEGVLSSEPSKKIGSKKGIPLHDTDFGLPELGGNVLNSEKNPLLKKTDAEDLNLKQNPSLLEDEVAFIPQFQSFDITKPLLDTDDNSAKLPGDSEIGKNPLEISVAGSPIGVNRRPKMSNNIASSLPDINQNNNDISSNMFTNPIINSPTMKEDLQSKNERPLPKISSNFGTMPDINFKDITNDESEFSNFIPQKSQNLIPSHADSLSILETGQDVLLPNMEDEIASITLDEDVLEKNNLSEIINRPKKTAFPNDQIKSESSLFNIPQDFNESEPIADILSHSGNNLMPEYDTEYSKPPTIPSSKLLDNPLSQQIPGKEVTQGNLFSPSSEEEYELSPTKMKISDNLTEPQISNPSSKYISKPVNPSKTAKNEDKNMPAEEGKNKTASIPPPSLTIVPGKSNINSAKKKDLEQDMLQNSKNTPIEEMLIEPSNSNLRISPGGEKMVMLNPVSQNDELANPYKQEYQNDDNLMKLGLPINEHINVLDEDIDFNDFFTPPKKIPFEEDNNPEDGIIDLSSFLGLNDENQLEDLIDNPNNKIKNDELPGNNHHEDIEDIFKESGQADVPISLKVDKDTETPNKIHPSNQNDKFSKTGNPVSTNYDSLYADDSTFDDFSKPLNNPIKNDGYYSGSEDLNPFNQKQLEDLDNILNNEKSKGAIPLSKLDNASGLENNSILTNSNGNPLEYKIYDGIKPPAVLSQATYNNRNDEKSNPYLNDGKHQQPSVIEINSPRFDEVPDFDDFFKSSSSPNTDDAKPDDNDIDLNMFLGINGLDEFNDLIDNGFSDEKRKNEAAELDNFSGMDDLLDNTEIMPTKINNLIPHHSMVSQPSTTLVDSSNVTLQPNVNNFVKIPSNIPYKENDEDIESNLFSIKDGINEVDNFTNDSLDNDQQNKGNFANKLEDFASGEDLLNNFGAFDLPNKHKLGAKKKVPKLPDLTSQIDVNPNNDDGNKNQYLPHTNDKYILSTSDEPSFDDFNVLSSDNAENDGILDGDFNWSSFPGVDDINDLNSIFDNDSNEKKEKIHNSLPSEYDDFSGLNDLLDDENPLGNKAFISEATKDIPKIPITFTPINSITGEPAQNIINDFQPDSTPSSNNNAVLSEFPFPVHKKNRMDKNGYLPHDLLSEPGIKESKLVTLPQNDLAKISSFEEPIPQVKVVSEYTPDLQKLPSDFIESSEDGVDAFPSVAKLFPNLVSDKKYFPEENLDSSSALSGSKKQPNKKEDIPSFSIKIPVIDTSSLQDGKSEIHAEGNDFVPHTDSLVDGEDDGKNVVENIDDSPSDRTLFPHDFMNLKDEKPLNKDFSEQSNPSENLDNSNLAQPALMPNNISGFSDKPEIILPTIKPTSQKFPNRKNSSIKMQGKANPSQKPSTFPSNKSPSMRGGQNIPKNDSIFPSITSDILKPSKNAEKVLSPTLLASKKLPHADDNLLGHPTTGDLTATQQLVDHSNNMSPPPDNFYENPHKYLEFPRISEISLTEEIPNTMKKSTMKIPDAQTSMDPTSNASNLHDSSIPAETEDTMENNFVFPSEDFIEYPNEVEGIETNSFVPSDEQFPFISPKNQRKPKNSNLFQNLPDIRKNTLPLDNKVLTGDNILELSEQPNILDDVLASLSEIQPDSQIDSIKSNLASTSPELTDENSSRKSIFDTEPLIDQVATSTDPDQNIKHDNEQWDSLLERQPFLDTDNVYSSNIEDTIPDYASNNPLSNYKLQNGVENEDLAADAEVNIEGNTLPPALPETLLKSEFPIPQTSKVKSKYPKKQSILDNLPLPQNSPELNQIADQLEIKPQELLLTDSWKPSSEDQLNEQEENKSTSMPINEKLVPQISRKPGNLFEVEKQSNSYPEMNMVPNDIELTLPSEHIMSPEIFENVNSRDEVSQPTINLDSEIKKSLENKNMQPNIQKPKLEKGPRKSFKNMTAAQTPVDKSGFANAAIMKEPSQSNLIDNDTQPTLSLNQDFRDTPLSDGRKKPQTSTPNEAEFKNEGSSNSVAISPDSEMKEPINLNQWPMIEKIPKKTLLKKPDLINTSETSSNFPLGYEQEPNQSLVQDSNDMPNLTTYEELLGDAFQSPLKDENLDQVSLPEYEEELKMTNMVKPSNTGNYKNTILPEESQYLNNDTDGKLDDENTFFENLASNPIHSGIKNPELGYLPHQEDTTTADLPVSISLQPMRESNLKHPKKQIYNIMGDTALADSLDEDLETSLTPQTETNSHPLEKSMESNFEDISKIEGIRESSFLSPSAGEDISTLDNIKFAHDIGSDAISLEQPSEDIGQSAKLNKAKKAKKIPVFESGDIDSAEEKLLQQMMKGWSNNEEPLTKIPSITIDDNEISLLPENNELLSNNLDDTTSPSQMIPSTLTDFPPTYSSDDININAPDITLDQMKTAKSNSKIANIPDQVLSEINYENNDSKSQLEFEHLPTTINLLTKPAPSADISSEKPLEKFSIMESDVILPDKKQTIKEVPFMYQEADDTNSPFLASVVDKENDINLAEEQRIPDTSTMENIFDLETPNDSMVFSENNQENLNIPQNEFPTPVSPSTFQSKLMPFESYPILIPQSKQKPAKFKKIMDLLNPVSVNNEGENLQNNADVPQNQYEPLMTENTTDMTKIDHLPEIPNDIRFSIDNETGEISSIIVPAQNIDINKSPILNNQNFLDDNIIGKAPIQQDLTLPAEPSYSDNLMGISDNGLGNKSKTQEQKFSETNISPEPPMSLMDILKLNDVNSSPEFNPNTESNNLSADLPAASKSIIPTVNYTSTGNNDLENKSESSQKFAEPSVLEPHISLMDILKPNHLNKSPEFIAGNKLDNTSAYLPSNINNPDEELPLPNQINTLKEQSAKQSDISPEPTTSLADILNLNHFDDQSGYNSNNELLNENLANDRPSNGPVTSLPIINSNLVMNNQQKPNQIIRPSLPRLRPSNSQQAPSISSSSNSLKTKNDVNADVPSIATVPKVKAPSANLETIITKAEPIPQSASSKPPSSGPPTQSQTMKKPITPRPVQIPTQPNMTGPKISLQNDSNIESSPKKPAPNNVQQKINDLMSSFPEEAEGSLSLNSFKMDEPLIFGLGQPVKPKPTIKPANETKPLRNTNGSFINNQSSRPTQQPVQMNSKPQTLPANSKPPTKPSPSISNNRPPPATTNLSTKPYEFDYNDPFSIFAKKETIPATNSVPSSQIERTPKSDFDGFGDLDILAGDDKFTEQEMMLAMKNPKIRPDILLSAQNTGNTNTPKVEKPPRPSFAKKNN